jgi:hypothetical protein
LFPLFAGVVDTGGKFTAGVFYTAINDTSGTGGKFTGGKFTDGVVDASGAP